MSAYMVYSEADRLGEQHIRLGDQGGGRRKGGLRERYGGLEGERVCLRPAALYTHIPVRLSLLQAPTFV